MATVLSKNSHKEGDKTMLISKTKENNKLVAYLHDKITNRFYLRANKKIAWGYFIKGGFLTNKGIVIPTWSHSSEKLYNWKEEQ